MSGNLRFEDTKVWQDSRAIIRDIHGVIERTPVGRDFILKDQIWRATLSIISNISEGFERGGDREFRQHLAHAKGSAGELRAQLYVCKDLGYINQAEFDKLVGNVIVISKQLSGLIRHINRSKFKGSKFVSD